MADWPPLINAAFDVTFPIYDNDGDPVSSATGLDSEVSIDGAAFGDVTAEATEISGGRGVYTLALTSGEMNGDVITTITISTSTDSKDAVNVMYTATRQLIDLAFPVVSGRGIDVTAAGEVGLDLDNTSGALGTAEYDADWLTNAMLADNVIAAEQLAADTITNAKIANDAIGPTEIATDAIDADALASDAVTEIRSVASGTSDAGGSTTTLRDAARTEIDDTFNYMWLLLTSGTDGNRARLITDFDATLDDIIFTPAVSSAIGAGVTYEILPAAGIDLQSWMGTESAAVPANALLLGAVDADVSNIQNDVITAASIAVGAIAADAFVAGAIDAAAIAADAIGASEIADNAIDAGALAVGAIEADAFAAGAIDAAAIAADAITSSEFAQSAADLVFSSSGATMAEVAQGVPAATPRPDEAFMLIYMALRNRLDIDTTATDFKEIYNDAGTVITKKTLSDDGTIYSEAKMITGP